MVSDELVFHLYDGSSIAVFKDGKVAFRYPDPDGFNYTIDKNISGSQIAKLLRTILLKVGLLEAKFLEAALLERTPNVTLHNVMNGMNGSNEQTNHNNGRAINSKTQSKGSEGREDKNLLTQDVRETLLSGGIDPDEVRYFGSLNGCASALNNSTNPVSAAKTMAAKPDFRDRLAAFLSKTSAVAPGRARQSSSTSILDQIPEEKWERL